MKPVRFREANKLLSKPEGMTGMQCDSLHVFSDGQVCVSKWVVSWRERLHCLLRGFVWVRIRSGKTQPPICLHAEKSVFE